MSAEHILTADQVMSAGDNLLAAMRYARRAYTRPAGDSIVTRHHIRGRIPFGWDWKVLTPNGTIAHGWRLLRDDAEVDAYCNLTAHRAGLDADTLLADKAWQQLQHQRRGYQTGTYRAGHSYTVPELIDPWGEA